MEPRTVSFSRLREWADVLRLSSVTSLALRPFAVELFRTQTEFNHRVVDVLEDAVWTAPLPDHATRVEKRLGPLAEFRVEIPRRRPGLEGDAIFVTKHAGLSVLRRMLERPLTHRSDANRALIETLKALGAPAAKRIPVEGALGLEAWFAAQEDFYRSVEQFIRELGDSLTSYAAAFARFGEAHERAVKAQWQATDATSRVAIQVPGHPQPEADALVRLPPDETLTPGALETIAELFGARPEVQLVYGDTFFTDTGLPAFKPGWSPEYLLSTNYIGGCFAMRAELARTSPLGGAALPCLLAQPLKESEVVRVPWVLSHRAAPERVELTREVRIDVVGSPTVTIIVPFKDKPELLRGLWDSLQRCDPGIPFELLLVSNQSVQPETFALLEQLRDPRVSWFEWNTPYNWSAINNAAATRAKSELLLFLNNDIAVTRDGWLRDLAGFALQPAIGVVGAQLRYADLSVQHAGVVIGLRGLAGHLFARWRPEYGPTPFGAPDLTRNWSAVTGACQMIRRALFEELGGFDEKLVISGGDIELCLRARKRGLRVVCVGHVELFHYESQTRGTRAVPAEDLRRERAVYADLLANGDPYFHPQLSLEVAKGGLGLTSPLAGPAPESSRGRGG